MNTNRLGIVEVIKYSSKVSLFVDEFTSSNDGISIALVEYQQGKCVCCNFTPNSQLTRLSSSQRGRLPVLINKNQHLNSDFEDPGYPGERLYLRRNKWNT